MAYFFCRNCGWSQDDFWEWKWNLRFWEFRAFGYNSISLIIEDIKYYIKPQFFMYDIYLRKTKKYKSGKVYSWWILLFKSKRHFRKLLSQIWWTYIGRRVLCPKCGSNRYYELGRGMK